MDLLKVFQLLLEGGFYSSLTLLLFLISIFFGREAIKKQLEKNLKDIELTKVNELQKSLASFEHGLSKLEREYEILLDSQIKFKERQLSEFYGPIYARLKRNEPLFQDWVQGPLKEHNSEVSDHMYASLRESNDAMVDIILNMVDIILNKVHLIEGHKIPESFISFLRHVVIWHAFLDRGYKTPPFKKEKFPEAFFPKSFSEDIYRTTEKLKKELSHLHDKVVNM